MCFISAALQLRPHTLGDAPIKVQHSSGSEIGVNIKDLDNPFGIKYKLNGFELGGCHPFQIRRVYILFQKGWRDIDVALRQLFSISVHLYRSMPPLRSRHTAWATLCEMRDWSAGGRSETHFLGSVGLLVGKNF